MVVSKLDGRWSVGCCSPKLGPALGCTQGGSDSDSVAPHADTGRMLARPVHPTALTPNRRGTHRTKTRVPGELRASRRLGKISRPHGSWSIQLTLCDFKYAFLPREEH